MRDDQSILNCDEIDYIYEHTLDNSPLRQFAVKLTVFASYKLGIVVQDYYQTFENTPEFAMDVFTKAIKISRPMESILDPRGITMPGLSSLPSRQGDRSTPSPITKPTSNSATQAPPSQAASEPREVSQHLFTDPMFSQLSPEVRE